jgi:S1-C subfamily serine protease
MVLTDLPKQVATQTAPTFRVGVLTVLILLVFGTVVLARRSAELEQRLTDELTRVGGIAELLERTRTQVLTSEDLGDLFAELQSGVSTARDRLDALEERTGAEARVIRTASRSTVFVQASYGFVQPGTGRPLRLVMGPGGRPVRNSVGEPAIGVEGNGPPLEILLTGTAFVVSPDGLALTNRHVANPWDFDPAGRAMVARGFEGRMTRFVGYLPGVAGRFELELVSVSDDADLAILCCVINGEGDFLPLAEGPPEPGEAVLVMGFPLGIRALMARTNPEFVEGLGEAGVTDFWEVAARLSRAGHVTPLASRGIVGQVTSQNVVYDAETTSGGSGGPVLGLDGRVVAINAAILPEFGGSNLGVPSARARELLSAVRQLP